MRGRKQKYACEDGVGARQEQIDMFSEGGRYPDNCTDYEVALGAKAPEKSRRFFAEINEMPIPPVWKRVAEIVGPDTFLELWRTLDNHTVTTDDRRVYVPTFGTYEKFQRNLMIQSMDDAGKTPLQIQRKLRSYGYILSMRSIDRVLQE